MGKESFTNYCSDRVILGDQVYPSMDTETTHCSEARLAARVLGEWNAVFVGEGGPGRVHGC